MASRAAVLASEVKNIKSELHFMQERCGLLEEENKRLRYDNGVPPEEDDLVRKALSSSLFTLISVQRQSAAFVTYICNIIITSVSTCYIGEDAVGGSSFRKVTPGARECQPD
jgi:hypothetical protein